MLFIAWSLHAMRPYWKHLLIPKATGKKANDIDVHQWLYVERGQLSVNYGDLMSLDCSQYGVVDTPTLFGVAPRSITRHCHPSRQAQMFALPPCQGQPSRRMRNGEVD